MAGKSYPKFKYHKDHQPYIVHNAADDALLGNEWKDSPADHGVVSAPSIDEVSNITRGFDPLEERRKQLEKEAQGVEEPKEELPVEESDEQQEESAEETPRRRRR